MSRSQLILGTLVFGAGLLFVVGFWFTRGPADPAPRPGRVLPGGALVVWTPAYRVSFFGIESLHPFDIGKVEKIGPYLVDQGLMRTEDFAVPSAVDDIALARVHDPAYLASLHEIPVLSRALEVAVPNIFPDAVIEGRVRQPFRKAVGGTVLAARAAVEHGIGINLGGGFHHARPAQGHGFCIYNDVAYAIAVLRDEGFDAPVLIIDTDAHQGDGNHVFFANDPSVRTFSMHGGQLFPHPKVPGTMDDPLAPGIGDDAFIARLGTDLDELLGEQEPGLLIHVAGSDVLADDPLGDMALTPDGLIRRDLLVFDKARSRKIPVLHTLAGGYGPSSAMAQARSVEAMLRSAHQSDGR